MFHRFATFTLFALFAVTLRGEFRASAVKVDITPQTPQWLMGCGPRQSTGVHDPILHRIVALDDGVRSPKVIRTAPIPPSSHGCERNQQLEDQTISGCWPPVNAVGSESPHKRTEPSRKAFVFVTLFYTRCYGHPQALRIANCSHSTHPRPSSHADVEGWMQQAPTRHAGGPQSASSRFEPDRRWSATFSKRG
jgi:hypothetical protein